MPRPIPSTLQVHAMNADPTAGLAVALLVALLLALFGVR
jgi:hypothetical protein